MHQRVSRLWGIGVTFILVASTSRTVSAQDPVFRPKIQIDQQKLLENCPVATAPTCFYQLRKVLESGGDFYTTPFQQYDPITKLGDGFGEGPDGPRASQRHAFHPSDPNYPFLRLNGLDSQSCFECHNSIGSSHQSYGEALMRKPYAAGGSAGSNSNAFINPLFPNPLTLFIRNPPIVFGTGYTQEVGDEMTTQLLYQRMRARTQAKSQARQPLSVALTANNISFGSFTTTYVAGSQAKVIADKSSCLAGINAPLSIGGEDGFTDDLTKLDGVACDLVIRPFQWKGVASSVRHFARDAMDFHFSLQAFEKFGYCDCDRDGKGSRTTGTEVTIGNVTALVSFVMMMRPPIQERLSPSAALGRRIFLGQLPGLYQKMCANCHIERQHIQRPFVLVEWPTNPNDEAAPPINPQDGNTYPILESACPRGVPKNAATCPTESSYSAAQSGGALVTPVHSSGQLPVVKRFNENARTARPTAGSAPDVHGLIELFQKARTSGVVGQDYVIPLSPKATDVTNLQLPRLTPNRDGTIDAPIFSDLKTHNMGKFLSDPLPPLPAQGTDVAQIVTVRNQYLTRPLWGVADSGPWLHDARATTLRDAILMHGDSTSGSEAAPVINAFEKLTAEQQQAVVDFLLTLRLPQPASALSATVDKAKP